MRSKILIDDHQVHRVVLGAARWSLNDPLTEDAAADLIAHAISVGVGVIDTARAYTPAGIEQHNERLIATALDRIGARDKLIVTTKGGHYRDGDRFPIAASPAALRADCKRSLDALDVDQLGLYYLHFADPMVPLEESVGELESLRRAGYIRHIGLCNVNLEQLKAAQSVAVISAVQHRHSVYEQAEEALLSHCANTGVTFLGYSPLGGSEAKAMLEQLSAESTIGRIGAELGVSRSTVMLAWLLKSNTDIGILSGASRPASIDSSVAAADLRLRDTDLAAIGAELAQTSKQARTR